MPISSKNKLLCVFFLILNVFASGFRIHSHLGPEWGQIRPYDHPTSSCLLRGFLRKLLILMNKLEFL